MDAGKPEPLGWWFETTRFENAPEVEEEVNPGRFGESLAEWLGISPGRAEKILAR